MEGNKSNIDVDKIVKHWLKSSEDDFNTMRELYNSRSFSWALFIGHISIEKMLKALYVKTHKNHAPFTHNLYRLAELCNVELIDNHSDLLDIITSFNINTRYDDYKEEFRKLCTPQFTKMWIENIKIVRSWISQKL